MKTEQAYTEEEVREIVRKAIQQEREFLAQTIRGMPCETPREIKQWWIENPKAVELPLKVFANLPTPQHLYEFRIQKDGAGAAALITRTRETSFVSEYAEAMANNTKEFIVGPKEEAVIRVYPAENLGLTGWPETDVFGPKGWEHVKHFGLAKCLQDDAFYAFYVRAAHKDQKLDEWIRVAHQPISASGCSLVFRVGRSRDCGRCFVGYGLSSSCRLVPGDLVAFRVAS